MKPLLLSGYGISLTVDNSKLQIRDGLDAEKSEHIYYSYKPKHIDLDNIVIYGNSGNVSIDAIKWLMKHNIQITVLNWNGDLLTTMNPPMAIQSTIRMAQYQAFNDPDARLAIAKCFIKAKIEKSQVVMDWLIQRYPELEKQSRQCGFESSLSRLAKAKNTQEILGIEGAVAEFYWDALTSIIDEKFEFESRGFGKTNRPHNSTDPINALFNYGYSILESQCRRAINTYNLDLHVGFLHEMKPTKESLVYDLQEPFRWLVDVAIIQGLEKKRFAKSDFIMTDNYVIRVRPKGLEKLVGLLSEQFNKTVKYQNRNFTWSSVIDMKAHELANFLQKKQKKLDFSNPAVVLDRPDNVDIREKILRISYYRWMKMGYSKGALHYMKKNAKAGKPFYVKKNTKKMLEQFI